MIYLLCFLYCCSLPLRVPFVAPRGRVGTMHAWRVLVGLPAANWRRAGCLSLVTLVYPMQYCAPGCIYCCSHPTPPLSPVFVFVVSSSISVRGHTEACYHNFLIYTGVIQQQQQHTYI